MKELFVIIFFLYSCVGSKVVEVEKGVAASLSSSEGMTVTFEDTLLTKTTLKTITLSHSGRLDLFTLEAIEFDEESPFQFAGDVGYPGSGGTCTDRLEDGESCTIVLAFTPQTERDWQDSLTIKFNDGIGPTKKIISLKGYGGNVAKMEVDSENIELGLVEPGGRLTQTVTLYNRGGLNTKNLEVAISGSSFFTITQNSCSAVVRRGSSCAFTINYLPTELATHMSEVEVSYDNPDTEKELIISFTGFSVSIEADLRIVGTGTYDFGSAPVGKEMTKTFTLSNAGYLSATEILASDLGPYKLKSSNCPTELKPKENCQVVLSFTPIAIGDDDRTFELNYNSQKSIRTISTNLKGKGVAPANLIYTSISPYNFGIKGIGDSVELTVMFANNGAFDATNVEIATPTAPYNVILNTCAVEMYPGYACMIKLNYTPTSVGTFYDQIRIDYYDGGQNKNLIFELQAEARTIGVLKFDQKSYYYGTSPVTIPLEKTMTLTNIGIGAISAIALADPLIDPFLFKGGAFPGDGGTCDGSLDPAESCTLVVQADSATSVVRLSTINLGFNNGDFVENKSAEISATFNTLGDLRFPGPLEDFQGVNVGLSRRQIIDLTNFGERTARVLSVALVDGTNVIVEDHIDKPCLFQFIGPTLACNLSITVTPPNYGVYTDTIIVTFDNGNDQIETRSMDISFEGMDLGHLTMSICESQFVFPPTAKNGSTTVTCTLTNSGLAPLTGLTLPNFLAPFSKSNITCDGDLNPAESCSFDLTFAPTQYGEFKVENPGPIYDYHNGQKNTELNAVFYSGTGAYAADAKFTGPNSYDFEYVVINTSKDKTLILYNSGGVPATNVAISAVAPPYSIHDNTCGATILSGEFCTLILRFTPTVVAVQHNSSITVTFDNGVTTGLTYTLTFKGVGEPPISLHRGWDEIYAVGNNVNQFNIDLGGQTVRLKWPAMTITTANPITSYAVYRRLFSNPDYNFNEPVAVGISTASRSFTDTTVVAGQIYYYMVKPIILGYPGRTVETFSEVRVVVPPSNMALGHRWMINQEVCNAAGMSPIKTQNFQCNFSGFGSVDGKFDIGSDIIMDRYEMGANYGNNPGQYPLENLSQPSAWSACTDDDPVYVAGFVGTFTKRLPSRKEYTLMGRWASTLNDATILAKERATRASTDCNGNSTESELTGNNTGCVSRYGVMDIPGNAFEWASDRILNGVGLEQDSLKLDTENTDLDGMDYTAFINGTVASSTYFSLVLGMPIPESVESYEAVVNITSAKLHDNYLFAPTALSMKIPLVGGSYLAATYSGLYSTAWVSTSYVGGARCMFRAGY